MQGGMFWCRSRYAEKQCVSAVMACAGLLSPRLCLRMQVQVLADNLKPRGRMVVPVGNPDNDNQVCGFLRVGCLHANCTLPVPARTGWCWQPCLAVCRVCSSCLGRSHFPIDAHTLKLGLPACAFWDLAYVMRRLHFGSSCVRLQSSVRGGKPLPHQGSKSGMVGAVTADAAAGG